MNGRARLTAVLEGKSTDRVPIQMVFYDGYFARCAGKAQWQFDYGTAEDQYEMQLVAVRRHPDNDGLWTWTGMNRNPVSGVRTEIVNGRPFAVFDDGKRKLLSDSPADGLWNRTPAEQQAVWDRNRIRSVQEVEQKMGPVVSADELSRRQCYDILAKLVSNAPNTFFWVNHSSLFSGVAGHVGGASEAWMATITEPDLLEAALEHHMYQQIEYVEAAARAGAHGVWNCFMYEGANILSPSTWRAMVKPRVAKVVARSRQLGLKHVAWFLDDCRPLVGDLMDIGIHGVATEQPRDNYQCEPGDLRRAAGKDLVLFGWFWEEDLLNARYDRLRSTLQKHYREAGGRDPFVVSSPGLTQECDPVVVDFLIEEAGKL